MYIYDILNDLFTFFIVWTPKKRRNISLFAFFFLFLQQYLLTYYHTL